MSELQYNRVRAVLYDPQYMNRQVTLGALQTLGLTQIEPVARTSDFESAIASGDYELLVAELHGRDDAVCDIVRRVRHRLIGGDPFAVILLTTWDLNADAVRAVLNSGADDLLARPYTIAQLQQRLTAAVTARKPFVVTSDYVGPSRRNATRAVPEDEVFDVPNGFKARVLGADRSGDDLAAAWRNVVRWKAIRLGRDLEASATILTKTAIPSGDAAAMNSLVTRMSQAAGDLRVYALQAPGPAYEAVVDFCAEMEHVAIAAEMSERGLRRFREVAALIADQVRVASAADARGTSVGVVPFYIT